jgi:hypothetical protein
MTMLRWIAEGHVDGEATNPQRLTARALATRRLVSIKGRGPRWHADLTDAGRHYLEHGEYPVGHFGRHPDSEPAAEPGEVSGQATIAANSTAKKGASEPEVDLTVDSPAGKRGRGERPLGDALFTEDKPDSYDEKILVTVKEAAWMLSLPEHAIRQAVALGDLDRVFIGDGNRNYRIIYGSLLAWVNSMPRESARPWWARAGARW